MLTSSYFSFVKEGNMFIKWLSLVSVQVGGVIKSSPLPDLSPNLAEPKPKTKNENGETRQVCLTLSAGLPHFATGYMRNLGRDTFIALRGLLLLTGRHEEARFIILGFAAKLRHGLIPNFFDKRGNARYNSRDAVWWWLYAIKCYVEEVPNGTSILLDTVLRVRTQGSEASTVSDERPLHEVMQEALTAHFQGHLFEEKRSERLIDSNMRARGLRNEIGVNLETGFVFGGNHANCGTWMNKVGSSKKAGNKGTPATPRDGSAIEIVGLSKCVLTFLDELHKKNVFPHYEVAHRNFRDGTAIVWSYAKWADKIQANFEKYFYVNEVPSENDLYPYLIHRRGIFKDTHGATQRRRDYQLRPNFVIAMVVAPELFPPTSAWKALQKAEALLLGPLGMKTLDPEDLEYNGNYDITNDSVETAVAHGFNCHQGPEWVWPIGYFLRARLHFAFLVGGEIELRRVVESTQTIISKHLEVISTNHWRGLPEFTNENGSPCKDSCDTKASSASSMMELLYDLQKIEKQLQSYSCDTEASYDVDINEILQDAQEMGNLSQSD